MEEEKEHQNAKWYDPKNPRHPSPALLDPLGFKNNELQIKFVDGVKNGGDTEDDWLNHSTCLTVIPNSGGSVDLLCQDIAIYGGREEYENDGGKMEARECYCMPCPTDETTFRLVIELFKKHGDFCEAR